MEVLDVACGTGNATLPAARAGARVTGLDFAPGLLEIARERAADAMVEVDFVEGDAQALPFEDGSFDRVVSTFGHMFAPDHRRAADEMKRVQRPGRPDRRRLLDARGLDRPDVRDPRRGRAAAAGRARPRSSGAQRTTCASCGATPGSSGTQIEWTDESVESYARFMLDSFGPLLNARETPGRARGRAREGLHGVPRPRERGRRRHAPVPGRVSALHRLKSQLTAHAWRRCCPGPVPREGECSAGVPKYCG